MRTTTVVHRRPAAAHAAATVPCSRPMAAIQVRTRPVLQPLPSVTPVRGGVPWSTAKLGLVVSTLAAIVALIVDATTALPHQAIVLTVMVVAFAVSLRATARRSYS